MPAEPEFDLALAGGGLANTLIAWRVLMRAPGTRVCLVEGGPTLGGNHTWSFHESDLTAEQRAWIAPLVVHAWPRQAVQFAGRPMRWVEAGYASITSERLHASALLRLQAAGACVRLGTAVRSLTPTQVNTADGGSVQARAVIDGRGFAPSPQLRLAHQKFLGLELELAHDHGLVGPLVMDADVPQHEGYRFVYVLPLAPRRLLIEDTYYADSGRLDTRALHERVLRYARQRGWTVTRVLREEQGVLPLALAGDIDAFWRARRGQPCSGLRAGLFHPTTGYSLAQAVRLADVVALWMANPAAPGVPRSAGCRTEPGLATELARLIEAHARRVWRRQAFFRALNRMLFQAARPDARHAVLAHFYRLPDRLVSRFYGERLSWADKLRIVTGKPPVPIAAALKAVFAARGPSTGTLP